MTPRTTHIAHVWVDDFFVRVERQANPALAGRPVVIGGSPDSAGRVVAVSVEAMACGVHPGIALVDAERLCPDAAFRPGRIDHVLEAAASVEEAVRRVAGPVEWCATDEAVLDLAQLDRTRVRRIAEELREAVRDVGHDAAVGVADTRTGARVAARLARPCGVLVVLPGCDGRFLAGLDLACLDELETDAVSRLRAAGVHTLGELARLAPADLACFLGREAQSIARRAAGIDARPVAATAFPRRVCRSGRFDAPPSAADVLVVMRDLVDAASISLRRFGCVARTVTLRVEDVRGISVSRSVDVGVATSRTELFVSAIQAHAARVATGLDVGAVAVTLGSLSRDREQLGLFGGASQRSASARRW
jgi:DNA polymerase-4